MIIVVVLAAIALVGLLLTTIQALIAYKVLRNPFEPVRHSMAQPFVSILKPLAGLEDEIEDNLASFAALRCINYEVIFSVASPDDPVIDVVNGVRRRFPDAPFSLVIGGAFKSKVVNPKVERLVAAAQRARGDIIFISDANIRVQEDDIARTIKLMNDPSVGCVSNLFLGHGASSFGALIESLHLLTFVLPGNALACAAGVVCVVGKSMAIRREAYEKIGGFEPFLCRLAEDQAMGIAIKRAGSRVVLSPAVVKNVIKERAVRQALGRQIRWNKIRYSFSKVTYTSEFLVTPLTFAMLACLFANLLWPEALSRLSVFAGAITLVRLLQARLLASSAGADLSPLELLLTPLQDLLQFVAQFAPYFSDKVRWHNTLVRLGPGTLMLPPTQKLSVRASAFFKKSIERAIKMRQGVTGKG